MHTIADLQTIFRSELDRLATCFHVDFRMTSSRPSAPIDILVDQIRGVSCPLLFKCFVAEAFEIIEKQRGRSGISVATNAQIETTLGIADQVFDQLKIDLATVFNPADLLIRNTTQANSVGSSSMIDRKLEAIDRIVGHPLANQDRQWRFARWSSSGTLNERLFPKESQVVFRGERRHVRPAGEESSSNDLQPIHRSSRRSRRLILINRRVLHSAKHRPREMRTRGAVLFSRANDLIDGDVRIDCGPN